MVDAANVIGSRPDGWWRDRPAAARRLLNDVRAGLGTGGDVVVVLEGSARAGVGAGRAGEVDVVHATGSGDDAIVDLVAAATSADPDRTVTVVTSDRGLRERVAELGAGSHGPHWLWDRVHA